MTILSVLQQAATVIGLQVPDAVFSSTQREHVELQALANEMAQRIAFNTHDWTKLKALAILTGTGAAESFALPTDYARMLKKVAFWQSATPFLKLIHYPDTDQWLGMQVQNFQQTVGGWTIIGDEIHIRPVVPNGATVKFYYLSNYVAVAADATKSTAFMADNDTFRLDERLLKLGIIWQWKANKGQAYAEDMTNYEEALGYAIGADKGSNILTVGRAGLLRAETIAYPGVLGR